MTPSRQSGAKQFVVAKILAEAATQGLQLSPAEQYMLSWSESDPGCTQDPALTAAFESETSERPFERKIVRVIRDAYARDVRAAADARARWRGAYTTLKEGDHYLLVMLREALGWRLERWFLF
jgi:hypothetical protein